MSLTATTPAPASPTPADTASTEAVSAAAVSAAAVSAAAVSADADLADADPAAEFPSHQSWLRTVLVSRLTSPEEVDEVLQEVALAAAHQSARQTAVARVGPWLYRVALRQVLLLRRREGRRRKLMAGFADARPASPACPHSRSPLDWLLSEERGTLVQHALASLSDRDRQLLLLKYVDGLSYQQIGQRLGVTASSVQSRLHRARQLLRARLTESSLIDTDELRLNPCTECVKS
jgi:RNA polymerase sigma factor (sigma-70 family)